MNTRVLGQLVPTTFLMLVFCLAGAPKGVADPVTLIASNAVWKYLDDGSDQGTDWREPFDYDDEGWAAGPAELGYGDSLDGRPEATVVSYGPDPQNKYVTTYFRHHFQVSDPASITNLIVRLLRDDGGVVYLNGQEIFRSNMTDENIDYRTLAEVAVTDAGETTYFSQSVPPYMLYAGENVMAVEIHQFNVGSGDISFALELIAETGPPPPVHLTRGPYLQIGTPTSIVVKWRTDQPLESLVVYGTDPNNLHLLDGDLSATTEHEVQLAGLRPATKYYYAIETFDGPMEGGPDYYFITSPPPGKARPTRIWAIGDSGTYGTGQGNAIGVRDAYYNYTGARETDVWLMLGDNAYNVGSDNDYQTAVFSLWTSILRKHVAWATIGNHETYTPLANGRFPFLDIFTQPINGEAGGVASGSERYYSFDYANIHFVCLDSMTSDRSATGVMANWLGQDLGANTNDWLIAFFHHPPYTKGSHDSDDPFGYDPELPQMRQNLVPILESYGVDLVLSGHSHIYERSVLLNGHYGRSTTLTPTMLKDSGSGRPEDTGAYRKATQGPAANQGAVYVVAGSSGWATFRTGHHPVMFADELEMGSLVVDINTNRLDAVFLRDTGAIDDHFTIIKGGAAEPLRLATIKMAAGKVIARWKSKSGFTYRLESSPSLENANWQPISPNVVASGATTSWTNSLAPGAAKAFYRVAQVGD